MPSLVIDCTELYINPVRTGIQRVVRELLRHWPHDRIRAHVARFDPAQGLVPIPDGAIRILTDAAPGAAAMSRDALVDALGRVPPAAPPLPPDAMVFIRRYSTTTRAAASMRTGRRRCWRTTSCRGCGPNCFRSQPSDR